MRPWLIGGAVLVVAAVIVVAVAVMGGGSSSPKTSAEADQPSPLAEVETTFKDAPEGCQLIEADTLARIAPEAQCTPSVFDDATSAGLITRMPSWQPTHTSAPFLSLDVGLTIGSNDRGTYEMEMTSALDANEDVQEITDSRPLDDLGDEAHVIHAVNREPFVGGAEATVIVRKGNATFTVLYAYSQESGTTEQQSEQRAIAAARDVLGSLS
jgi:hypothetical protein